MPEPATVVEQMHRPEAVRFDRLIDRKHHEAYDRHQDLSDRIGGQDKSHDRSTAEKRGPPVASTPVLRIVAVAGTVQR